MLPITSGEITFPATRMMKSSPKLASKISSGGTRESAQPSMVAYGCWPLARAASVSLHTVGKRAFPDTNRLFPSINLRSPCSADITILSVLEIVALTPQGNDQHPTPAAPNVTLEYSRWFARAVCRLMVDKISTVPKAKIGARVGRLADEDIVRMNRAVLVFLGLAAPAGGEQLE